MPKGMKGCSKPYKYYLLEKEFNNEEDAINFINQVQITYTHYCLYHYGKPYYYTKERNDKIIYVVSYVKVDVRNN